jgi:hypothetical protein
MFNPTVMIPAAPVEEELAAVLGELGVTAAVVNAASVVAAAELEAAAELVAVVVVLEKLETEVTEVTEVAVELAATRVTVLVTEPLASLPDPVMAGVDVGPAPALLGPPSAAVVVAVAPPQPDRKEGEYVAVPW